MTCLLLSRNFSDSHRNLWAFCPENGIAPRHTHWGGEEILVPAIGLAKSGTTANQTLVNWLGMAGHAVFFEQRESRETFFPDGVTPLHHGEFYKPPHLDSSLELIAREGADALYRGDLGKAFSEEITGNNG